MMGADSLRVSCYQACQSGGFPRVVARAVRVHSHRTSRCVRRSRPTCRRLASDAPGQRPSPRWFARSPARWLQAAQRPRAADARSVSEGQRRKARQKGAAPSRPQSQSARGGGAARSGFAAVPLGARSPHQDRAARVLRTIGHATACAIAFKENENDRPPRRRFPGAPERPEEPG